MLLGLERETHRVISIIRALMEDEEDTKHQSRGKGYYLEGLRFNMLHLRPVSETKRVRPNIFIDEGGVHNGSVLKTFVLDTGNAVTRTQG